jgi:hypothetical protein
VIKEKCTNTKIGALLHAYELDLLSDEEARKFEQHLLECDTCLTSIQNFTAHSEILLYGKKLQREVAAQSAGGSGTSDTRFSLRRRLWPDGPLAIKPAILVLLVLLLLYPAYLGIRPTQKPQIQYFQAMNLVPYRSATTPAFYQSRQKNGIIAFVIQDAIPGKSYSLQIIDDDNQLLYADSNFTDFDISGIGHIAFPADLMKPGQYKLRIEYPQPDTANIQEYRFLIKK